CPARHSRLSHLHKERSCSHFPHRILTLECDDESISPMALYRFVLERFHIDNTRSRHEDTDTVSFGARAGEARTFVQSKAVGDVNNGDHGVGIASPPLYVPAQGKPAVFSYFIYNGDTGNLSVSLDNEVGKVIDLYTQQILEGGPSPDPDAEIPDDPDL